MPADDREQFARLPDNVRGQVLARLSACQRIATAPSVQRACKAAALAMDGELSWRSLKRLYYAYAATADWRVFVNRSRAPELSAREGGLPAEFVLFWKSLCQRNQREKASAPHVALMEQLRRWRAGDKASAIPGYDFPPADAPGADQPAGWSYSNLARRFRPTPYEQRAASIGRRAASEFRPQVYTTRVGLRVGQVQFFDDQVHDARVNFVGNRRKAQRPLELVSMDCFSASFTAHGFKPVVWNDATESRVVLRGQDMIWFATNWLLNVGWRPDTGTQVICEHGTAAFPDWLRAKLSDLSQGKITFQAGGVDRRAAFPGMFDAVARGNFRIKAGLESSFNLVRNRTADSGLIPGQVGKDRDHAPEEWDARLRNNELLLLASQAVRPEVAALLRYPLLEWRQFLGLALEIYDAIDARTNHDLEGWEKAGLLANEWRLSDDSPWLPMARLLELGEQHRLAATGIIEADTASLQRVRKLSPREVWQGHRQELMRAPGFWIALILPPDMGAERKVDDDHLFEFDDQEIAPDPLRFLAEIDGRFLRPGETFLTHINPFAPDELYVCDARGRYLGACRRWRTESKGDLEAIHRRCGEAATIERRLLEPVARAGADLSRQRAEDVAFNARLLARTAIAKPGPTLAKEEQDLAALAKAALMHHKRPEKLEE